MRRYGRERGRRGVWIAAFRGLGVKTAIGSLTGTRGNKVRGAGPAPRFRLGYRTRVANHTTGNTMASDGSHSFTTGAVNLSSGGGEQRRGMSCFVHLISENSKYQFPIILDIINNRRREYHVQHKL